MTMRVEDYASVMLRSASGILGTVEVGNMFPRDGTDGEWKIAGRDAILTMKDNVVKLSTADGRQNPARHRYHRALFHRGARCARPLAAGKAPPIGVQDCLRAVRLIDQAYAFANSTSS